jgi:virulence-associated protein VagC
LYYIVPYPNDSGAYPSPQSNPFPGAIELTDKQAATLVDYNGFVNIIRTDEGVIVTPNTEAWEAWKAEQPDYSEQLAVEVRAQRDALLAACDWTQMPDSPLSEEEKVAYQTYRQALRDVPQQKGFPETINWPEEPKTGSFVE